MAAKLLPFGQSYWDYLPNLVQYKILNLVHKSFLERVHEELLSRFVCGYCGGSSSYECECERCSGGQTKINCPNTRIWFPASAYERAFYPQW